MIPDMMLRIEGSPDLYGKSGRTPYHSINFITSHDGFTMNDLVSYATKHNGDNLEGSRDGTDYNYSWSWGVEGPTHELEIESLRKRLIRNFFTILFISEGVPMLLGGDEFLRTQQGNNNAYCHDNELNYFDWGLSRKNCDMVDFVRKLIKFRKGHPHFLCRSFFTGTDTDRDRLKDINWLNQDLMPLNAEDYELRTIAFLIGGHELRDNLSQKDIDIMAVLNSHWQEAVFRVPACVKGESRYLVLDTSLPAGFSYHKLKNLETEGVYKIAPRSVAVFLRKLEGR
jgi:glycogen operon protein